MTTPYGEDWCEIDTTDIYAAPEPDLPTGRRDDLPRTPSTELNALPVGSVLRSAQGKAADIIGWGTFHKIEWRNTGIVAKPRADRIRAHDSWEGHLEWK